MRTTGLTDRARVDWAERLAGWRHPRTILDPADDWRAGDASAARVGDDLLLLERFLAAPTPSPVLQRLNRDEWRVIPRQVFTAMMDLHRGLLPSAAEAATRRIVLAVEPILSRLLLVLDPESHLLKLAAEKRPTLGSLTSALSRLKGIPFDAAGYAPHSPGWDARDTYANAVRDLLGARNDVAHRGEALHLPAQVPLAVAVGAMRCSAEKVEVWVQKWSTAGLAERPIPASLRRAADKAIDARRPPERRLEEAERFADQLLGAPPLPSRFLVRTFSSLLERTGPSALRSATEALIGRLPLGEVRRLADEIADGDGQRPGGSELCLAIAERLSPLDFDILPLRLALTLPVVPFGRAMLEMNSSVLLAQPQTRADDLTRGRRLLAEASAGLPVESGVRLAVSGALTSDLTNPEQAKEAATALARWLPDARAVQVSAWLEAGLKGPRPLATTVLDGLPSGTTGTDLLRMAIAEQRGAEPGELLKIASRIAAAPGRIGLWACIRGLELEQGSDPGLRKRLLGRVDQLADPLLGALLVATGTDLPSTTTVGELKWLLEADSADKAGQELRARGLARRARDAGSPQVRSWAAQTELRLLLRRRAWAFEPYAVDEAIDAVHDAVEQGATDLDLVDLAFRLAEADDGSTPWLRDEAERALDRADESLDPFTQDLAALVRVAWTLGLTPWPSPQAVASADLDQMVDLVERACPILAAVAADMTYALSRLLPDMEKGRLEERLQLAFRSRDEEGLLMSALAYGLATLQAPVAVGEAPAADGIFGKLNTLRTRVNSLSDTCGTEEVERKLLIWLEEDPSWLPLVGGYWERALLEDAPGTDSTRWLGQVATLAASTAPDDEVDPSWLQLELAVRLGIVPWLAAKVLLDELKRCCAPSGLSLDHMLSTASHALSDVGSPLTLARRQRALAVFDSLAEAGVSEAAARALTERLDPSMDLPPGVIEGDLQQARLPTDAEQATDLARRLPATGRTGVTRAMLFDGAAIQGDADAALELLLWMSSEPVAFDGIPDLEGQRARLERLGYAAFVRAHRAALSVPADDLGWRELDRDVAAIEDDGSLRIAGVLFDYGEAWIPLVLGWLSRHRKVDDPENLRPTQRFDQARARGLDVPAWMDDQPT